MRYRGILLLLLLLVPLLGLGFGIVQGEPAERKPGVKAGDVLVYGRDLFGRQSTVILTVTNIYNNTIFYNWNETVSDGAKFDFSYYVDVNGFNGSIGQPFHFIGTPLSHGDLVYKGFLMKLTDAFWGKIILGSMRDTIYYKEQSRTYLLYHEWDKYTGVLTESRTEYLGFGDSLVLKGTNVWENNQFWSGIGSLLGFFSFVGRVVVPLVGLGLFLWFFSFIPLRIKDWYTVKRQRGSGGSVFPSWLKMIFISAFVFIMLWLAVIWILSIALGGF